MDSYPNMLNNSFLCDMYIPDFSKQIFQRTKTNAKVMHSVVIRK